jgi:ATP-dependent Lon protease
VATPVIAVTGSRPVAIARKHLLPRQLERAGLKRASLKVGAKTLRAIVEGYSREAGVRRLDNALATLVRKAAVELLSGRKAPIAISPDQVADYLGPAPYRKEALEAGTGIVTGLAWTPLGGATLPVEATRIHSRNAELRIPVQLGDVLRVSASIAYRLGPAPAGRFGPHPDWFEQSGVHLHVPAGATPKDGPSAGITMAAALLSLARDRAPRRGFAMTGELTLTGQVYPVGGIREKLIAAKRQGIKHVILPEANRRDLEEVPEYILAGITVHFVETFDDVVGELF